MKVIIVDDENSYDTEIYMILSLLMLVLIVLTMPIWVLWTYIIVQLLLGIMWVYLLGRAIGYDTKWDFIYFSVLFMSTGVVSTISACISIISERVDKI